ncbi:hypothetical protein [Haloplanus rubicundus]|uniref:Uncharacterized protein n=1 Tax=Haloplanus rubicundus TaxID=1547898 RepID=A0A345EC67_9EURY|nr:hypothetical protein [Haloplanus rubicundus]AXG09789.1 hypothetical protein DU484_07950 [Haloplanus rubicundus]
MPLNEIATTMGEIGSGAWELRIEGGETIDAFFDEVEVSEERGFHAEGRNEERGMLYELTTGKQPGGPVRLRRRPLDSEEWEEAGAVVEAVKQG